MACTGNRLNMIHGYIVLAHRQLDFRNRRVIASDEANDVVDQFIGQCPSLGAHHLTNKLAQYATVCRDHH